MSFFPSSKPASATTRFYKPRGEIESESGIRVRRRTGIAYWRGSYNYRAQPDEGVTALAELEKADAQGEAFWADLYLKQHGPLPDAIWHGIYTMKTSSCRVVSYQAADVIPGRIVSFRSSLGREFVTARVITEKVDISNQVTELRWATPVPVEFASNRPGIVFEACFNRPHVRAKVRTESLQWTSRAKELQPLAIGWEEDVGANLNGLGLALRSPLPPADGAGGAGGAADEPPQNRFFITDDGQSYIGLDDGRFLVTDS